VPPHQARVLGDVEQCSYLLSTQRPSQQLVEQIYTPLRGPIQRDRMPIVPSGGDQAFAPPPQLLAPIGNR